MNDVRSDKKKKEKVKFQPKKKYSEKEKLFINRLAGTTMFKKQKTKNIPFFEPINLGKKYP